MHGGQGDEYEAEGEEDAVAETGLAWRWLVHAPNVRPSWAAATLDSEADP